jgi:hypothetical protein
MRRSTFPKALAVGVLLWTVPVSAGAVPGGEFESDLPAQVSAPGAEDPVNPCAAVPDGPSFASVVCRLGAQIAGMNDLGASPPALVHTLTRGQDRARTARDLCARTYSRKAKWRLKQTERAVAQYAHRLRRLAASQQVDDELLASMEALRDDVKTLRKSARCRDGVVDVYALPWSWSAS